MTQDVKDRARELLFREIEAAGILQSHNVRREAVSPMGAIYGNGHTRNLEDAALRAIEAALSERAGEVQTVYVDLPPELPRLTDGIIYAACAGHYGARNFHTTDGVAMTVQGVDYSFTEAFRRMWTAIRKHLREEDARKVRAQAASGKGE